MSTVVVIEDQPSIRKFITANLEARDIRTAGYGDAESGLAAMQSSPPDAVVLDIWLPGMNGVELLAQMADDSLLSTVPVVIFTASHNGLETVAESFANVTTVLPKPIGVQDLLGAVMQALTPLDR